MAVDVLAHEEPKRDVISLGALRKRSARRCR